MRHEGLRWGRRSWLAVALCTALLACASRSSEQRTDANANAGKGGSFAAGGTASSGEGGRFISLFGGMGGSLLNIGGADPALPGLDPGVDAVCLDPYQIPSEWIADAGAGGSADCPVAQLGTVWAGPCAYDMVDTTPLDVDPILGGHSRCCYQGTLIGCLE